MILGITGISGTGKSVAAQFFEERGWKILDADTIAHYLYRPYTYVWKAVVKRFGEDILTTDDIIDRQKLRKIVFDADHAEVSYAALDDLNKIIHPAIRHHLEEKIHRYYRRKANVAVVAALWKEIGLPELCEKILLITAPEDKAFLRIKKRDNVDEAMYQHYAKTQTDPPHPDFTVENSGALREFYKKLEGLPLHS